MYTPQYAGDGFTYLFRYLDYRMGEIKEIILAFVSELSANLYFYYGSWILE